jgi:hypothetical protein
MEVKSKTGVLNEKEPCGMFLSQRMYFIYKTALVRLHNSVE